MNRFLAVALLTLGCLIFSLGSSAGQENNTTGPVSLEVGNRLPFDIPGSRQSLIFADDKPTQTFTCGYRQYLVGLAMFHSDRILGLSYACVSLNKDGTWFSAPAYQHTFGRATDNLPNVQCQPGSYIVGLNYSTGQYVGDSVFAQATPLAILADLQPVCRNAAEGTTTWFNRARLTGAENNHITDFRWDGVGSPKSCPEGEAATGIGITFDNSGIGNQFRDVQLVCGKLSINEAPPSRLGSVVGGGTVDPRRVRPASDDRPRPGSKNNFDVFEKPVDINNIRYGYCLVAGNLETCGQAAADALCKLNHDSSAVSNEPGEIVNATASLRFNQDFCHHDCKALTRVTCRK